MRHPPIVAINKLPRRPRGVYVNPGEPLRRVDQSHEWANGNDKRKWKCNDLPYDDPALKWAWEIFKEADHLVHSRTTFFFAAQSFLVVAYSIFAVSRFNWKENQSIYIIAMGIIVFMGVTFSLILWELNYTLTKRMKEKLRDTYLERNKMWKEYAEPRWLPARIIFGTVIPLCLLLIWTGFGITTLLISRLPA